jgi:peptidoglycan/xylan/chitin deacetylase (PgdA/CDA1 family)
MTQPGLTCCITLDFDALSIWIGKYKATSPTVLSRGEYGATAIPRILRVLAAHDVRATFFTPGHTVLAYPETMRRIAAEGHEIAHHGWVHESPDESDPGKLRTYIERGLEAIDSVLGQRPIGYRAPGPQTAQNLALLLEYGFVYDSTSSAADFSPYYARVGDVPAADEPFVFGETVDLVEVPFSFSLADFGFEYAFGTRPGVVPPSAVEEIWRDELQFALRECAGGVFAMTLHPEIIGRGHRLLAVERTLEHIRSQAEIMVEPVSDYVTRWKAENPIEAWKLGNPTLAGGDAHESRRV